MTKSEYDVHMHLCRAPSFRTAENLCVRMHNCYKDAPHRGVFPDEYQKEHRLRMVIWRETQAHLRNHD